MYRLLCGLVTGGILTGFALLLLIGGRYRNRGSVMVTVIEGRGLHVGDLFVIAGWLVAMVSLFVLSRQSVPRSEP